MKRRFPFTTLYLLLLLVAVIASWLVGLYGVSGVHSLLSIEGIRWWMRVLLPSFASSFLPEVMLVLFALGIVRRSFRRWNGRALVVAVAVFILLLGLVLWGVVSGSLLSVSGCWAHSPLQVAWLPLLAGLVSIPALCYGLAGGIYTSGSQILRAFGSEVARCAPAFVTLFVASQLTSVLAYSGLPAACGMGDSAFRVVKAVVCWLPFAYEYLIKQKY